MCTFVTRLWGSSPVAAIRLTSLENTFARQATSLLRSCAVERSMNNVWYLVYVTLMMISLVRANQGNHPELFLEEGNVDPSYKKEMHEMLHKHFIKATGLVNGRHANRAVVEKLFRALKGRPLRVIETGTSAWGIDSTRLFDTYIRKYGGYLHSVDVRAKAGNLLIDKGGPLGNASHLHVADSVKFLKYDMAEAIRSSFPRTERDKLTIKELYESVDLFFLDSHDVDWESPDLSAFHGFSELMALLNPKYTMDQIIELEDAFSQAVGNITSAEIMLRPGALIWIDDTPKSEAVWEPVQGGRWHTFHMGPKGEKLSYVEQSKTKKHMELSGGIFPGKGSFCISHIFNKFPEKFKQVFHGYSMIYKVL